jgi:SAM-dependent methyltransferase
VTAEGKDIFARSDYRRMVAWPERIRREAPFLEWAFADAPAKRLLDLGCGTGEHSRHFAERGWTAVGIDLSEAMVGNAGDLAGPTPAGGSARFEVRDIADAGGLPEAPFGAALCVGNTLAFSFDRAELDRVATGAATALLPGAPLLLQMLNYERLERAGIRHLPLNFRDLPPDEGNGEIVFLRAFRPHPDGLWDFWPISLTIEPDAEEPVKVRAARRARHRAWRAADLEAALGRAGFRDIRTFGGIAEVPFDPESSPDLVIRAIRA